MKHKVHKNGFFLTSSHSLSDSIISTQAHTSTGADNSSRSVGNQPTNIGRVNLDIKKLLRTGHNIFNKR